MKKKPLHRVVRHNDGWVHKVNGTLSEVFRTREAARKAAREAALAAGISSNPTALASENRPD